MRILVIDEEQLVADSLVQVLNMVGFNACSLYSCSDAVEQATRKPYDVLIGEVVMDGLSGIDAAIKIRICMLLALLCSITSSNSIVKPIATVVSHLRSAARTGVLPELEGQSTSILEIRELTEIYNRAARRSGNQARI